MNSQGYTATHPARSSDFISAAAAALVMAVGMGFGRFAFTGVYPLMVHEGLLSVNDGTLAASANYAGYLLGALLAARLTPARARHWSIAAVLVTCLCLAALSVLHHPWMVVLVRGVAGLFSALSMVSASLWLLQHRSQAHSAPLLYAGVGIGILLSAELLALGEAYGLHSPGLWIGLAAAALVVGVAGILGLDPEPAMVNKAGKKTAGFHGLPLGGWSLIVIYGLAGFGYIVTATYLPLLVKNVLGPINPIHVWAVFGLGAAPSCYLWHKLHRLMGTHKALRLNLVIQAIGVVLPVVCPNAFGYMGSALIVGATFMGTVTIAMPAARRVAHTLKVNMLAAMTAAYGLGQIVGPLVASSLYGLSGSFNSSLITAALALAVGTALTFEITIST